MSQAGPASTQRAVCRSLRAERAMGRSDGADRHAWDAGHSVGVGYEYAFLGNWSAKIEFDYLGSGEKRITLVSVPGGHTAAGIRRAAGHRAGQSRRQLPLRAVGGGSEILSTFAAAVVNAGAHHHLHALASRMIGSGTLRQFAAIQSYDRSIEDKRTQPDPGQTGAK